MKNVLLAAFVLSGLWACDNVAGVFTNESSDSAKAPHDAIFGNSRDLSITKDNAYSDLFLDSAALEKFVAENKINDSTANLMRAFYNSRNLQFAWFNGNGFTEQGQNFWNLYNNSGVDSARDKDLYRRMDTLVENVSSQIMAPDSLIAKTELALTEKFVRYATADSNKAFLNGSTLFQFIPVKKSATLELADSILHKLNDSTVTGANAPYRLLKEQLAKYYAMAQNGGWQPVTLPAKTISKGTSAPVVASIKKRLQMTGDYNGDTTQVFTDSLQQAIKSYQQRNGFKPTGVITDSLVAAMNIPVEKRIQQIIVNLNRMVWMPSPIESKVIEVNIPEYMLSAYEGNSKAFDMEVIVGKEGANTMMFSGNLNQIVFSPYWNIPPSIVKEEIVPAMKTDPNYLKKHHMEIVSKGDSIPVIRQVPGPENSLGKVKFLFPNSYEIFLHDTPAKNLFEKDKRAFSHGCIRLADAQKMAAYLLQNDKSWTPEKIQKAMNSGKEQFVKLDRPVPVLITYFTAWIDDQGLLNFRDDVYQHDDAMEQRLFATDATTTPTPPDSLNNHKQDTSLKSI